MKFAVVLPLFAILVACSSVSADDIEITAQNVAVSFLESAEVLDAREYLPRDCFRYVETLLLKRSCYATIPVWRWSIRENKCVTNSYSGCNRTKNNFPSEAECNSIAKPICEKLTEAQLVFAY